MAILYDDADEPQTIIGWIFWILSIVGAMFLLGLCLVFATVFELVVLVLEKVRGFLR